MYVSGYEEFSIWALSYFFELTQHFIFFFLVLGMEPRSLCMLFMHSTAELHPQSLSVLS
jgi:hypothetical protein